MMNHYKEVPVDMVGGSNFGRYAKISISETWNMYVSDDWILSFPGWKKVLNISDFSPSSGRGSFVSERSNLVLCVINNSVYTLDSGLEVTFVGRISTSVGQVSIDENLNGQIGIVDGLNLYIYNVGLNSLTKQILDKDLLIPNSICYHNTFLLIGNGTNTTNRSKWFAFSYESPTTVSITTELTFQIKPDSALAIVRLPGSSSNVLVFGSTCAGIYTNVGGLQNYTINQSLSINYGCLSVYTIATNDDYVMWLSVNENNSPVIMMFSGNQKQTVSTDGISSLLAKINYPEQSSACFFKKDGHLFYVLTFYNSADNISFCYDTNTKLFSFLTDHKMNYFPVRNVIYFNNKTYFLSINNGSFYELDSSYTTYDENIGNEPFINNNIIPRIRICSPIRFATTKRFRSRNFTFPMDQGNDKDFSELSVLPSINFMITEDGNFMQTEDGKNTMIMENSNIFSKYYPRTDLTRSTDGGETFGSPMSRMMNFLGKRQNIFNFNGPFGLNNDLRLKIRFYTRSYVCAQNGTLEVW